MIEYTFKKHNLFYKTYSTILFPEQNTRTLSKIFNSNRHSITAVAVIEFHSNEV